MLGGWIKLHRSLLDHWLSNDPEKLGAWIQMILMANHAEKKILIGGELVLIERGSFFTSQRNLMKKWRWGRKQIEGFLHVLEQDQMIATKGTSKGTYVSIINYDTYQDIGATQEQRKEPRRGHVGTSNKNEKNEKKEDPSVPTELSDPISQAAIQDWLAYKTERREGYKPRGLKAFYTGLIKEGLTGQKLQDAVSWTTFKGWAGIVPKPDSTLTQGSLFKNQSSPESAAFSEALRISVDIASSNQQTRTNAESSNWRIREAIKRSGGSQRYRQSTERDHQRLMADFSKAYRELEHAPQPREPVIAKPDITSVISTLINKGNA